MTNSSPDLILANRGGALEAFVVGPALQKQLRSGMDVQLFEDSYQNRGNCCEWLEIVEIPSLQPAGVMLLDFYEPPGHASIVSLKVEDVTWSNDGRATFLYRKVAKHKPSGGPYLPVCFYSGKRGNAFYFIAEGGSIHSCAGLPIVGD